MKHIVEVQFTGNAKTYSYLIPDTDADHAAANPGVRVVVVSKMKDDGTASLSIATIVGVGQCSEEVAATLKPYVQIVNPASLALAVAAYSTAGAAS